MSSTGPGWKHLYEKALLELDPKKLDELVSAAEGAVHNRLSELHSPDRTGDRREVLERRELQDALFSLQCLRRLTTHRRVG